MSRRKRVLRIESAVRALHPPPDPPGVVFAVPALPDRPAGRWVRADGLTEVLVYDPAGPTPDLRFPGHRDGQLGLPQAGRGAGGDRGGRGRTAVPAPYSPDLNPIERAFSKLKARLRAAAKRTIRAVEDYLGELSATFHGPECRNYFASCGYSAATPDREPL